MRREMADRGVRSAREAYNQAEETLDVALDFGTGIADGLPFELNARLRAQELVSGGVEARGVVLEYGFPPSCP